MLNGIRVLDLSQFVPGPYATRMLADLGAEVIKVETPGGDPMRTLACRADDAPSPVYRALNRGKRVVGLDLKSTSGRDRLVRLVQDADVLLESFRPGVMARLGLDWPALQQHNAKLVYCSLSGYGQTGAYERTAGHDVNYCAAAGIYSPRQIRGGPAIMFPPIADHCSAMLASNTILAALLARTTTGEGRHLDISIYESMLAFRYVSNISAAGGEIDHVDFICGNAACYNIYETADRRFVTLGAVEPKFWAAFCDAMGEPGWVERQQDPYPQRQLIAAVQERFRQHGIGHWNELLFPRDCCYEPVPLDHEVLQHPQTRDRRLVQGVDIAYPAWVDGEPLQPPPGFKQLDADQPLRWNHQ